MTTPTGPAPARNERKDKDIFTKSNMKKASWIVGIVLLLALLVWGAIAFYGGDSQATAVVPVTPAEVGKTTPANPDMTTEVVPEKPSREVRVEKPRKVTPNYFRMEGGSVVNKIGRPVTKAGKTYLPLFRDGKALMEPVDREVTLVQENMTFEGTKPPRGRLAVYDTILTRDGQEVNVLAWEVAR